VSRTLRLRHGTQALALSFQRRGDTLLLTVDGRTVEAKVSREGFWFDVRTGGSATRCAVARGRRGLWVSCEGRSWLLEEERAEAKVSGSATADELRAPMTGRVVQVAAESGGTVKEGDLLVTIEAMKMEFRLVAPENGVIAEVRCEAGARVELGDLLVTLEPRA